MYTDYRHPLLPLYHSVEEVMRPAASAMLALPKDEFKKQVSDHAKAIGEIATTYALGIAEAYITLMETTAASKFPPLDP